MMTELTYRVEDNGIFASNSEGTVLAEITFSKEEDAYCIHHTFVDDSLRGMGIAGILVQKAVDEIQRRGYRVTATCSYAVRWLEKHPEVM